MKLIFTFISCIILSGCGDGFRNNPRQQVEDRKICIEGGMDVAINAMNEVVCIPKLDEYTNLQTEDRK